jgi:serine/threonine protein kinase
VVAEELSVKLRHSSETTEITAPPTSPPEPIELARTASAGSQSAAHISEISERFCIDSSIYVSYDYAPGEDLQTLVSRLGPSRELEVMAWAIQLAEMMDLHHQHAEPPIYGVLRPSKLILDNMGSIHLTNASTLEQSLDGVVSFNTRAKTSNGASRVIVGEQSYTSPEQLRGNAACQSDDIYSFGCTLFYLLTGRQPEALRPADLSLENILLSNWFIELIKACTAFEPAARPKTFAEILHILKSHESMPESLKCRRKYESSLTHGPLESSQTPSEFILRLAGCSSLCTTDDSAIIDLTSKQRAEVKF